MIKNDDNKREGRSKNEKEQKKNRNNKRERISIIDKENSEETTLSTGIKIDEEKLKNNKRLYDNIKMRLISLVSRSKLPLFNMAKNRQWIYWRNI